MDVFEQIRRGLITRKAAKDFMKKESLKYNTLFVPIEGKHPNPDFVQAVRNKDFLVQIFKEKHATRLSINKTKLNKDGSAWEDGILWDDIQRIKRNLGYGDSCAIELYPPEKEVVNVANIRHIFIVENAPEFMWKRS